MKYQLIQASDKVEFERLCNEAAAQGWWPMYNLIIVFPEGKIAYTQQWQSEDKEAQKD